MGSWSSGSFSEKKFLRLLIEPQLLLAYCAAVVPRGRERGTATALIGFRLPDVRPPEDQKARVFAFEVLAPGLRI